MYSLFQKRISQVRLAFVLFGGSYLSPLFAQQLVPTVFNSELAGQTLFEAVVGNGNGRCFAHVMELGGFGALAYHDASGEMIWKRQYASEDGSDASIGGKMATTSGDLLIGQATYTLNTLDSDYVAVTITRIDPGGAVVWSSVAQSSFVALSDGTRYSGLARSPLDESFVLAGNSGGGNMVFKFTSTGELQWARLLTSGSGLPATHLTGDVGGGCTIAFSSEGAGNIIELMQLDAVGDLAFARVYTLNSSTSRMMVFDMMTSATGEIIVGGAHRELQGIFGTENYFFLLRLDPSGTLDQYQVFSNGLSPAWSIGGGLFEDSAGSVWLNDEFGCVRTGPDGYGQYGFHRVVNETSGYRISWTIDAHRFVQGSDTVWVGGSVLIENLILGGAIIRPFLSAMPQRDGGCFFEAAAVTTVSVGGTVVEMSNATIAQKGAMFDHRTITISENVPITAYEMCAPTEIVDQLHPMATRLTVLPSPADRGSLLRVVSSVPSALEILDLTGKTLDVQPWLPTAGERTISTHGLTSGVYLLRSYDRNGLSITTTRFVLQ